MNSESPTPEDDLRGELDSFDERVRAALNDSPVPAGLDQRLISRVRELSSDAAVAHTLNAVVDKPDASLETVHKRQAARDTWRFSRRSLLWATGSAAAASLLGIGYLGQQDRPTKAELTYYACQCLEEFDHAQSWRPADDDLLIPDSVLAFIVQNLRVSQSAMIQAGTLNAGQFGSSAEAWKITDGRQTLYVMHFQDSEMELQLTGQLQMLPTTGSWSVAAQRVSNDLVLIAARGNVTQFIQPQSFT